MKKFIISTLFITAILLLLADYDILDSAEYFKMFLITKIPATAFIVLTVKANKVL